LANGKAVLALEHFTAASQPPANLGEEFHYLQSRADVNFWRGEALNQLGRHQESAKAYNASADEVQDFQQMAVKPFSSFTYYRGLSLLALGRTSEADDLFTALGERGRELQQLPGEIDYFATSLPNMLVFEEDQTLRNQIEGKFLEGLALLHLEGPTAARDRFQQVLELDPSHYGATDQLRA
jgi:tetratricopeptide (TPR) repeat protein